MSKKVLIVLLFCLCLPACFKKIGLNENAILQQRACIEAIELNDLIRAQTHCELCLEYDASMPECLNGIGLIALMNRDEEKARSFFGKALRQHNDFTEARNNLGVIEFSHGSFNAALKYFDRSLEIDPSNTDARYNAGLSHFRLAQRLRASGDFKQTITELLLAKDQMMKLLAVEPSYFIAFRDLGLIELNLYDMMDLQGEQKTHLYQASVAFSRCIEAKNDEDGCHEGLAQVYLLEGKFNEAFAQYFLCLTYGPENSACRHGIIHAYEKSAQVEGGYNRFAHEVKNDGRNAFAHEAFCVALFERGLDSEAAKECEVALRIKPDLCSAQFRLAQYFLSVSHHDKATRYCQSFLACGHSSPVAEIKKCQEILAKVRR